jgi:hypothetical protein
MIMMGGLVYLLEILIFFLVLKKKLYFSMNKLDFYYSELESLNGDVSVHLIAVSHMLLVLSSEMELCINIFILNM